MSIRHWGMIILTAALFGSSFLFIKIAVAEVPPFTVAAGRAAIAAVIIVVFATLKGARLPTSGRDWRPLLIVGVLTAVIPYSAIAGGQALIDSSLGGILFGTIPLFTVLLAPIFLHDEQLTMRRLAGALIGLGGVATVIGPSALTGLQSQLAGIALTLLAAASYAAGGIYTRRNQHISPFEMAAGQMISAAPLLFVLSLIADAPWQLQPSATAIGAIVAVAAISTAIPVLLFFRLVREVGPTRTSILTFFMPAFAVFLGTTLLGERPDWTSYAGLALIIAGAILVSIQPNSTSIRSVSEP